MKRAPSVWQRLAADPEFRTQLAAGWTIQQLQEAHEVSFGTVQRARRLALTGADAGDAPAQPQQSQPVESVGPLVETRTTKGDGMEVLLPRCAEQVRTLADLYRVCEVDAEEWECDGWTAKAYQGFSRAEDGTPQTTQLYSVSARFKARVVVQTVKEIVAGLLAETAQHVPHYAPLVHVAPPAAEAHLWELCLPDWHGGKRAWSPETGDDDYDLEIAERIFDEALEALVRKSAPFRPERILFPIGHDLLHVDGSDNLTTRGTPQDVDGRFKRTFRRTVDMLRRWTERLSAIAPVDLVGVPGNHDREAAWAVVEVLGAAFARCPHVTVQNEARLRKYYTYGNVLLTLTHGSEEKPKCRLSEITASEVPALWGRSVYREAHTGHLHHYSIQERHGFRGRVLPSLCPADSWHAQVGFVNSQRTAVALIWTREDGLAAEIHHNVRPASSRA